MTDALKVTRDGPVLEVVIDRPKANAIDAATSRAMGGVFASFRDDPELLVAIFSGAGERFFSAGWDLKSAAEGESADADYGVGGFGGFPGLPDLNKPVITAINGLAVGGGFEIAMAGDLIVCAEHARMWLSETRLGLVADTASFRLPKLIPRALAMELLLTGRELLPDEARAIGLVNRVVPAARLMEEARAMAAEIARGAPLAVAATKEIVRMTETMRIEDCYPAMAARQFPTYERLLASDDVKEGAKAFVEGRDPVWTGR
ncbi:enoyl-CoA hydratase-related protein [Microbaculum marinum]|uniref:Enoyl-CoA hydratase-related protein n=1 Tax=Microbaculum marinum TaxID=1764581 RepID=A0AAW9RPH7_9HYPH